MSVLRTLLRSLTPRIWTPSILSWIVVLATLSVYGQLLTIGPTGNLDDVILGRILGTLDTSFGIVLAYWLGTSRSSHDKDETIRDMARKK